jgi:hypothetical protein
LSVDPLTGKQLMLTKRDLPLREILDALVCTLAPTPVL